MSRGGKRPGAGAPRKPTSKRVQIGIRVDAETEALLRETAKRRGKTLSEWIRDAIMSHYAADVSAHS